jgi:hypothetical protein
MKKILILSMIFAFTLAGCGDTGFDRNVKTTKVQPQKPGPGDINEKLKDEAIKAGVLLDLKKDSLKVLNTSPDSISIGAWLELNSKDQGYRNYNFELRNNEIKSFENRNYDLNPDSRLGFEVYRFQKDDNQELLVVHFKFENRVSVQFQKSSQVVLVNLKASKPMQTKHFFFPLPEDFDIKNWADDAIRTAKPNPARDSGSRAETDGNSEFQKWDSSL